MDSNTTSGTASEHANHCASMTSMLIASLLILSKSCLSYSLALFFVYHSSLTNSGSQYQLIIMVLGSISSKCDFDANRLQITAFKVKVTPTEIQAFHKKAAYISSST